MQKEFKWNIVWKNYGLTLWNIEVLCSKSFQIYSVRAHIDIVGVTEWLILCAQIFYLTRYTLTTSVTIMLIIFNNVVHCIWSTHDEHI